MENARPYADTLSKVLANVAGRTEESHPLLERRDGGRVWLVVVSSDKGLCGSFNANMLRQVEKDLKNQTLGRCRGDRHRSQGVGLFPRP